MKIRLLYVLFLIMLTLYGLNHAIFERKLFFNEILSFVGIIFFFTTSFTRTGKFILPKSTIYRAVLFFLLIGAIHMVVSLWYMTNLYFYFRNSVIFYAAFTFFLGFHIYPVAKQFYNKASNYLVLFFAIAFAYPQPMYVLDRYTGSVFLPFLYRRKALFTITGFLLIMIVLLIYAFTYKSSTVIFAALFFTLFVFVKRYAHLKLFLIVFFTLFISFFIYISPVLKLYKTESNYLFGDVVRVYNQNPVLQLDYNSSWRLILWYRVIVEKFPENLVGIGFGTPLIEYQKGQDTADSDYGDEHDAHVMGMHNTYITVFVRLGLPFLIIMIVIFDQVFRDYFYYKYYYIRNNEIAYFFSFFALISVGLFNLVLESPIVAALYWCFLGFIARMIEIRKLQTR